MKHHAFPAPCPRCDAPVLTTQWDFTEQMPRHDLRAEPISITPDTETACIILERPTYGLYTRAGKPQIVTRDARWHHWRYHGTPLHILPAHQCGTTLPGTPIPLDIDEPLEQDTVNQLNLDDHTHPF